MRDHVSKSIQLLNARLEFEVLAEQHLFTVPAKEAVQRLPVQLVLLRQPANDIIFEYLQ